MKAQEFIPLYHSLFRGRPDVYAIRSEWTVKDDEGNEKKRSAYIPSNYNGHKETTRERVAEIAAEIGTACYDEKAVSAHVRGRQFLGVYPLHEDSTVWFAALDFDGDSPDEAWDEARLHYNDLLEADLPCYIEVSQSGNGFHLWLFFEEAIDAGVVRRAIKPLINKSAVFDRMFPNQNSVTEHRPLGNLIALPLHGPRVAQGKSCFIDPDTREPFEDQKGFLAEIERIPVEHIQSLAASAPELPEDRQVRVREGAAEGDILGINKVIDTRFGCEWVNWMMENPEEYREPEWYALACNLAQLHGGRDVFHEISSRSSRYDPRQTDAKFDQAIEKNAPHTCEYIRENLGGPACTCDRRFPGKVYHPYDLATLPVFDLISSVEGDGAISEAIEGLQEAFGWAEQVQLDPLIGMGLPTGIASMDEHFGFRNATLNVFAARPSIGKTAWAMDVAYRAAMSGVPVYFFSLEMSRQQLWRRLLCRAAGVSASKMRKGELQPEDWQKIREAQAEISAMPRFPLFVEDTTRDIRKIMDIAWNLKEEHGHGIVMIDYLGLLDWYKGENEYAGITRNSKESKLLAKATDMPVLLLHQFNRQGDDMSVGAETSDSWLRSSGQIEQDADVILYLLGDRGLGIKEREIVKQKDRDGEAGIRIMLEFNPYLMQFGSQGTWFALNSTVEVPEESSVTEGGDNLLTWGLDD